MGLKSLLQDKKLLGVKVKMKKINQATLLKIHNKKK
jgi:hypothetical protein